MGTNGLIHEYKCHTVNPSESILRGVKTWGPSIINIHKSCNGNFEMRVGKMIMNLFSACEMTSCEWCWCNLQYSKYITFLSYFNLRPAGNSMIQLGTQNEGICLTFILHVIISLMIKYKPVYVQCPIRKPNKISSWTHSMSSVWIQRMYKTKYTRLGSWFKKCLILCPKWTMSVKSVHRCFLFLTKTLYQDQFMFSNSFSLY